MSIQQIKSGVIADNAVTAQKLDDSSSQLFGFRNKIINGAMNIAQRGTSFSPAATRDYFADRFWYETGGMDQLVATVSRVEDGPSGTPFSYSAKYTVTTPETAIAAHEYAQMMYFFEYGDNKDLLWGTASAKDLTFSFWVKSSVTGAFPFTVSSHNGIRNYGTSYTISSANTWVFKTITIPGDTGGDTVWRIAPSTRADNEKGIELRWGFNDNSETIINSGDQWTAADNNYRGFKETGCTLVTTNGATWQITGIQAEVGSVATPFERRPFGTELALCQRYYQKSYQRNVAPGNAGSDAQNQNIHVMSWGDGNGMGIIFPVVMRAAPTVTLYANDQSSGTVDQDNGKKTASAQYTTESRWSYTLISNGKANTYVRFAYTLNAEI